jgi:hypothetical protein
MSLDPPTCLMTPTRTPSQPPSHRRDCASELRGWVRWVAGLLALGVALQGSAAAMARAAEPAHFHVAPAEDARDPMLDQVRVVLNHHGASHRHATPVERHSHEPGSSDVVYLDDDATHSDAPKNAAGKRALADLDAPPNAVGSACVVSVIAPASAPTACTFDSHIDDLLERPPR